MEQSLIAFVGIFAAKSLLQSFIGAVTTATCLGIYFLIIYLRKKGTMNKFLEEINQITDSAVFESKINEIESFIDKSIKYDIDELAHAFVTKKYSFGLFKQDKDFIINNPNGESFNCQKCMKSIRLIKEEINYKRVKCEHCEAIYYWDLDTQKELSPLQSENLN